MTKNDISFLLFFPKAKNYVVEYGRSSGSPGFLYLPAAFVKPAVVFDSENLLMGLQLRVQLRFHTGFPFHFRFLVWIRKTEIRCENNLFHY